MRSLGFARLIPSPEQTAKSLSSLLPSTLPGTLKPGQRNLYETLARLPNNGVGATVYQKRWARKGIEGCTWKVTQAQLKNEGKSGKAWGVLFWKGKLVSEKPERISGALKYNWKEGVSKSLSLAS